ncbi:unnamed protein product [Miscanthus lutarioriparius]|uniref:Uncharacterized protein n=1 Tax=Miscanthus lutarioriparius TaxID=422564 RepID=A0A811N2B3_9POAL|nr:unnamed protein product [Miscanthus lutarioriparius]
MSRRAKQQPAAAVGSRRTRRAELPRPPAGLAESPQIVSNPIFRCEAGPSQPNRPPGDQLRCVYGPGSLYALVYDPAAGAGSGSGSLIGKAQQPLPLPPCRAYPSGRVGTAAHAVGGPHGRVLRRAPPHDPFLAAYVACSKRAGGGDEVVDRPQHKQKQGRRKKKKAATGKKCKAGVVIFRGCGIWSGWAAGAKYAGAMSCRYGCAVAGQKGDAPATKTKSEDDAPAGPTLDLSWTPAVLSARALERREQR